MPNGGSDCCAKCDFNHARGELDLPIQSDGDPEQPFHKRSFCVLRHIRTPNPFWTYCANFRGSLRFVGDDAPAKAHGPVFASGLYEGYVRIPWHGDVEPSVDVPATCSICGRKSDGGILLSISAGEPLGFCTNRHYVEWWRTVHDDPRIKADRLATPEEYYKE